MAITLVSTNVEVAGYKYGSTTATSGTSSTITKTAAGWTVNAYVDYIVWIISGTGAGATGLIASNTATVLTCTDGFWKASTSGTPVSAVTPDSTSVFAIAWNFADCVAALPAQFSWENATVLKRLQCNTNLIVKATGALADFKKNLDFTAAQKFLSSEKDSMFQLGKITLSGSGSDGGEITGAQTASTYLDLNVYGLFKLYGSQIVVNKSIADSVNAYYRYNVAGGAQDGVHLINCYVNRLYFVTHSTDVYIDVEISKCTLQVDATPAFMLRVTYTEANVAPLSNTQAIQGIRGGDLFDLKSRGDATVGVVGRPIFWYVSNLPVDVAYFWRPDFGYYTPLSNVCDYYSSGAHAAITYIASTIDVAMKDSAGATLGTVIVGLIKTSDGTGQIITGKNASGSNYSPITARFITTDGSGAYTGPFGAGEGIEFLYAKLVWASQYVSTVTDYSGYTLLIKKYGYRPQALSRGYDFTNRNKENGYCVVDPYAVASYATAIAYTGLSLTAATLAMSVSLSHTIQELYDFVHARDVYEASTNGVNISEVLSTTDGNNYTSLGDIVVSTTKILNGAQTIAMGAKTLSTEFSTGAAYTYTGGSWKQATTTPTFNGGTLNIGAFGAAVVFAALANQIVTFTPASAGTYDLGGVTSTGILDLRNLTAFAITVQLAGGVGYTTANNTGGTITISAPIVSQGLAFTSLIAGSKVVVYTTGTQTALYTDASSGTTSTFSQTRVTDITVDYTVQKAGYTPIRVTGVLLQSAVLATPIQQDIDRAYAASSGLTFGTTATVNTGTKRFIVTAATTVQNWYSFMIESWISQSTLANVQFPLKPFGSSSFSLGFDWEWFSGASIALLSGDGMRYVSTANVITGTWAAIQSVGTMTGLQAYYQQVDGSGTTATAATGVVNQLIQVYGDATHGNFDYTGHLVFKAFPDGYDEAEVDVFENYGTLSDQLYIIGMQPLANSQTPGDPGVTGVTITDHGASPVTWNGVVFSITITDSAGGNTGAKIMEWLRYNKSLNGTFQGKAAFNWHDLVRENGTKFKTVRSEIYGDVGAYTKGVRVVLNNGTSAHPDFSLFTGDTATYTPPLFQQVAITGLSANSRIQIYDATSKAITGVTVGATTTITSTAHGFLNSDRIFIAGLTGADAALLNNQYFNISGVTANTYVVSVNTTGKVITPGSGTGNVALYNAIVAGTSYTWVDSQGAVASRSIRLRIAKCIGANAYNFIEVTVGTCGITEATAAVSYVANQTLDTVYNTNAVDGSTITGITITPSPARVKINIAGGTIPWKNIYAYQVYWLYGSTGVEDEAAFISAVDTANYLLTNFMLKNTSTTGPVSITGGWGRDSTTLTVVDVIDTTTPYPIFPLPDHVAATIVTVGGVNIITGDISEVAARCQTGMTNQGYTTTRAPLLDNMDATVASRSTYSGGAVASVTGSVGSVVGLTVANLDAPVSGVPTAAQNAAQGRIEFATELTQITDMAKIEGLVFGVDAVITTTSRNAGAISQTIADAGGTVIVHRV